MKNLLLMLAILVSGIASAQEITVTELRVSFGPADRVVVFQPGSCQGSITPNGGAYEVNPNVDPITFTWVGETDAGTLNRRIFDELNSNQEHGVVYQHNRSLVGGNIIFQCPPAIPSHFAELFDHNAIRSLGTLVLVDINTLRIGSDIVIRYRPETNNYEETWNGQISTFRTQRSYIDVVSG